MAETHEGNTFRLRGGFATRDAAEDHPVKMKLWKRIWVEELPQAKCEPAKLPPKPWDWVTSGGVSANGKFHAYLTDATGRKIAAIWGREGEKELIADHILDAVNGLK